MKPRRLRGWLMRLIGLFSRGRREREFADELESHLQMHIDDNLRAGMSPEEARRVALIKLGGVSLTKELHREQRGLAMLETLWQDLRFGLRMLRKNPGFTLVAVLSLALGIGANTAIFQLIDAVRLRMLPVSNPQDLVEVRLADTKGMRGGISDRPTVTWPIWEQIRERQQAFSSIAAWGAEIVNLAPGGEVRNARLLYASGDFFRTLGVGAVLGRVITATDDQRGCDAASLVISHEFWQREYGGETGVIGRKLTLANRQFEIIGVTPAGFFGMEVGRSFDLALPVCAIPLVRGNNNFLSGTMWWLTAVGRLKPGWSLEQATAQTQAMSPGLFETTLPANYPSASVKDYLAFKLIAVPGGAGISQLREEYEQSLWLLLGIAGSVLLIACANLANLLLARAETRQREIAVRQSLGASRARVIRQLLVESLLLATIGATLGVMLAQSLSRVLVAFLNDGNHSVFLDLTTDWRVFGFAAGLAVLTCLLFGLAPAIRATRMQPGAVMKAGGRGMTAGHARPHWGFSLQRALTVAQVALSLALVAGALLFSRSLGKLLTVDAGFRQEGVLTAIVTFHRLNLPPARHQAFKEELLDRLRTLPGVDAAAAGMIPLRGWGGGTAWMDGENAQQGKNTRLSRVGPDYFKTLEIPLLAGRDFAARDRVDAPEVAIVNEAFARQFAQGANPVGRRLWIAASPGEPDTPYEIVGLVRNTKYESLREEYPPIVYYAASQNAGASPGVQLLLRSRLPQAETIAAVKRVLNEINPAITVNFQGFKPMIEATILRERLLATLSGFFGVLALALACIGLYGILSYNVASRTNEIGIRMALGAQARDVRWLVLREALWLVVIGVAVGLPLVFVATRLAAALLFGLTPTDPVSLLGAAALLLAVALVAGYLPSRRATKVDPMIALRHE